MINIKNIVRANILELKPYSSARDEFSSEGGVFLDANENPFGKLNRYPDPKQIKLKQKLAELKGVNTNSIFVGNGSDEVIDLAYRIFCNPGKDKALTFSPTYGMYEVSAAINHIEILKIPLNQDFQIDMEKLKPYLDNTIIKLIFICSPNNPTGNLMNKNDIESILNCFKGIVIIDEAYIDFSKTISLINLIKEYNNLIVCQTLSKAWGLAAARIGIAYSNKDIISLFNKIKPPYNVSTINQEAAIIALSNHKKCKDIIEVILTERSRLQSELSKIKFIKCIYPSEANFLLIEVENANQLYNDLINKQVITRNRHTLVANCLRISIGTPEENNQLINALKLISRNNQ